MEKSSQIAWKIVPLVHFFPLKVVPLIEVLLYGISVIQRLSNSGTRRSLTIISCLQIGTYIMGLRHYIRLKGIGSSSSYCSQVWLIGLLHARVRGREERSG
jgi:hypothetical protein